MNKLLHIIGLCVLALPLWADENIVLNTGFRLPAERHELDGGTIRIFSNGGVTEMPSSLVVNIEHFDAAVTPVAPVPAAPEPAPQPTAPQAQNQDSRQPAPIDLAHAAAAKYALPDAFVAGVMRTESGFNVAAVSPKGAIGLMQLMPETARTLGVDPQKPAENADAGARYLRDLLAKYEDRPDQVALALAAYNAGPAAVERYHGVPPYPETHAYILRVFKAWNPQPIAK
jgi:soluble lytic murein transglycosylase-like protein